ncbi:hypothetical protein GNZ10_11020 [Ralstonia sp. 3N]|nr:hypothetical protein HMPREF1004_03609 [Ralstonia pickettii]NPT50237.1 hypothetical protein [Ralstonia sp. 3N]
MALFAWAPLPRSHDAHIFETHAPCAPPKRFVDALTPFGIGASWGGYESLATISNVAGHAY